MVSRDRKHKILFLHNIPSPYRIPLFRNLQDRVGYDFNFMFTSKSHRERKWTSPNLADLKHEFLHGVTIELGPFILTFCPKIFHEILRRDYDVIILSGMSDVTSIVAAFLSKIRGVRILIYSEGTNDGQTVLGRIMRPLESFWLKNANGMVLPGISARRFYSGRGITEERIFIAPDAVDNDYYIQESERLMEERTAIKKRCGIEHATTLLFVGRLVPVKGIDTLIRAYHLAKIDREDLHLLIVGDGSEKESLERYCTMHEIRDVHFMGWAEGEEKCQMYLVADVFIFPTRSDVWGLVINEAMCFKLPIIASSKAGAAQDLVIDGVNGYVIPPDNPEKLKEAILMIIKDRGRMLKMGQESYRLVTQSYSIKAEGDGFIKAIDHIVDKW